MNCKCESCRHMVQYISVKGNIPKCEKGHWEAIDPIHRSYYANPEYNCKWDACNNYRER